jgi:hypothetical protein
MMTVACAGGPKSGGTNKASNYLLTGSYMMKFGKAMRRKAKLRLALTGPSGAGKTYSALQIAVGIGGKIALIDTEKGSASLYSHLAEFDVLELNPPYAPERFIEAIKAAEDTGYDILIIDSITHEWSGVGGCLELVDEVARARYKGNSWSAWNDITPRHRNFLDAMLRSPMHIIATARSKTETAQTEENGRKKVVKLGMKAEQRDGVEYEFTTVLDIVHDGHYAVATKDRTGLFTDADPKLITPETGKTLLDWLESGEVADTPPPVGMDEGTVADHLAVINDAATLDELKARFEKAYESAKAVKDKASADKFTAAKDARKIILTTKEPS